MKYLNAETLLYITVLHIALLYTKIIDMKSLTKIQHAVYTFASTAIDAQLPFPSLREIANHFGFTHTTARFHLKALEKKGYIQQREQRVGDYLLSARKELGGKPEVAIRAEQSSSLFQLVASIPAGIPATAYEESSELFALDNDFFGGGDIKALRVKGESMTGDAISDGDIAMIRLQKEANKRDILALRIAAEITLKRIRKNADKIELVPSNPEFPIRSVPAEEVEILGRLVGIVRKT